MKRLLLAATIIAGCQYPPGPDNSCLDPAHGPVQLGGELVCDTDYPTVTPPTYPPVDYPTTAP